MSFKKPRSFLFIILALTFIIPITAFSLPFLRATKVHTTCPACYFLSAQNNQTARTHDNLLDQRAEYQSEMDKLKKPLKNLEGLKKARQSQYQKSGAPGAAKIYKDTLAKIRKIQSKVQKKQKEMDSLNKKIADVKKQLKEDRQRYEDCMKKYCKKAYKSTSMPIFRVRSGYYVPEMRPGYIKSACDECNKKADKCNELGQSIKYSIDYLKMHREVNMEYMGAAKYFAKVERDYKRLYYYQSAWAVAYKDYLDCLEEHCKPKAKPYDDAYLDLSRDDQTAMTAETDRNNAIGVTADFGTTHRTASFGGPFRASENGTRIDGAGGTVFYQRYFEDAPQWSVVTDAGYPGDHNKVVLRDHFDPFSPYVSDIRITKSWFVGFGAERQVVAFGGDCKDDGGNAFSSGCNTVSVGAGLSVTSQELKANIGEFEVTTASDTELLVGPFVVADLTLPVCTHTPECSTDAIAFVFDVKATWLPRQEFTGNTPAMRRYEIRTNSTVEVDISGGIKFGF